MAVKSDLLEERKQKIVEFMREEVYNPLLFEELVAVLDVPESDIPIFAEVLEQLEEEGKVFKTKKGRYGIPEKMNLVAGVLQGNEKGFGFVIPDEKGADDIFIPAENLNGAMHRDRVIARVYRKASETMRSEGEIIKILKRFNTKVVGTYESSKYFGFVIPDDKRLSGDIFVPKSETGGAENGDKVVVEILQWPEKRRNAEGRIIEVLGKTGDPGTDILSIIRSFDLPEEFPEKVMKEAEKIPDHVTEDAIRGREDLRELLMVTIDGEDAKDLDDAVSLEYGPEGLYHLGVHIADVSHYVKENSALDKEALKRGTSVYLVDRVIPMLPKELSNGICSLNPNVDRLALSVLMDIDSQGRVISHRITESVIRSKARMTYTDVTKILVDKDEELIRKYSKFVDMFRIMEELAKILRERRMKRGAIDFDFGESKIVLDERGKPIDVKPYPITISNRIIEEFMLVCNEVIAEEFFVKKIPFVYRIHEDPDPEKMDAFRELTFNLGYPLRVFGKVRPEALQALLKRIKGQKEERLISTLMLRSLQKARYSSGNEGHFGLAAEFYCHFTSPIRRYPDLMIHRIIKEYLKGNLTSHRLEQLERIVPEVARQSSEREVVAEEAERATEELKKVEYMVGREGEEFDGIISSVTSFGMFVELENTIEGLIRLSNLEDDYYVYDEQHYCLIGERHKKIYRIGDEVRVRLIRADLATRQIDFVLSDAEQKPFEAYYFGGSASKSGKSTKKAAKLKGSAASDDETLTGRKKKKTAVKEAGKSESKGKTSRKAKVAAKASAKGKKTVSGRKGKKK